MFIPPNRFFLGRHAFLPPTHLRHSFTQTPNGKKYLATGPYLLLLLHFPYLNNETSTPVILTALPPQMVKHVHQSVAKESLEFLSALRRYNYVTPTSYLEVLSTYRNVLTMKRLEVGTLKNRLQVLEEKITQFSGVVLQYCRGSFVYVYACWGLARQGETRSYLWRHPHIVPVKNLICDRWV